MILLFSPALILFEKSLRSFSRRIGRARLGNPHLPRISFIHSLTRSLARLLNPPSPLLIPACLSPPLLPLLTSPCPPRTPFL